MVYLSATVVHSSGGRVWLPWEIVQWHSESITIRDFFITIPIPRLGLSEFSSEPEWTGCTDVIYLYIMFLVSTELGPEYELYLHSACMEITDVFVGSTRNKLFKRTLLVIVTPSLTQECNRKDKLYNVVVRNFKHRGIQWRSDEAEYIAAILWNYSLRYNGTCIWVTSLGY